MEFYESPYFIVLVPSVVIAVIFLFFWLFMKETLYDEALAKQKRDQKLLPSKTDKKKAEKKKSKKKEAQNGNLHESDSESTPRDFRLSDAVGSEEEHIVPLPLNVTEAPSSLRERKKKEKKHKGNSEELVPKESESSKSAGKKVDPVPVTKQPTPPSDSAGSKKKSGQKKQKNGIGTTVLLFWGGFFGGEGIGVAVYFHCVEEQVTPPLQNKSHWLQAYRLNDKAPKEREWESNSEIKHIQAPVSNVISYDDDDQLESK